MARAAPKGLGPRGRRLWRELVAAHQLGPAQLVLAEESCRLADRLDRFNAILAGDESTWFELVDPEGSGTTVTVTVTSVLSEARLTATALKGLITELRQATSREPGQPAAADPAGGGGSNVTDLRARIAAARSSASAG